MNSIETPWMSLRSNHSHNNHNNNSKNYFGNNNSSSNKTSDLIRGYPSHTKQNPVSRAITFGSPVSKSKMNKMVREQMDQMRCYDKAKWGFDFYNERPASSCSNSSSSSNDSNKYDWKKSTSKDGGRSDSMGYTFYGFKKSCKK